MRSDQRVESLARLDARSRSRRPRRSPIGPRAGRSALLTTTTRGASRRLSRAVRDRRPCSARDRSSTTSMRSATSAAPPRARDAFLLRLHPSESRRPAVSTRPTDRPRMSARSVSRSRVVPGMAVTIARLALSSALNRLDLPTFGVPTIATCAPSRINRPRAAPCEQRDRSVAISASISSHDRLTARRSDSPRPENRATPRAARIRSNSAASIAAIARGQRALELIERRARLQRRDRLDQIGHGFRLHEIELAVEKRAQRELAGLGEPRARGRSPRRRTPCSTTGLPCALISATSSPV